MKKFAVDRQEWYPVYAINPDLPLAPFTGTGIDTTIELSDEEIVDYALTIKRFEHWQDRLRSSEA